MDTATVYRQQVGQAIRLVRRSNGGRVSLDDMAAAAGVSIHHFDRIFRRMIGMAAARYVRWFRLNCAAIQLIQSNRLVIDIALTAGYTNHESFCRAFKIQFKTSPRGYRNRGRVGGQANQQEHHL